MTTGVCVRCGKKGEVEYGADGLPYCSSCIFYGLNRQCSRCRMYLPASEMQQYKGMWVCPNCLMDMRDEDKPKEEKKEKLTTSTLKYQNTCERCGKEAEVFYIFNNKRLCASCYEDEAGTSISGRKPFSAPIRVTVTKKKSFFEKVLDFIQSLFGIRKKSHSKSEIVAYRQNAIKGKEPLTEKNSKKTPIEAEVIQEQPPTESFKKFKKE
ncbi:MAG: hypothetical protein QXF86_03405 [Candidatus Bilamarchaeaceae archaeon]